MDIFQVDTVKSPVKTADDADGEIHDWLSTDNLP